MDATRLPPPAASQAPATVPSMPTATAPGVTQPDQPAPVGGRFALSGVGVQTATGVASDATDVTTGAMVVVKLVANEVLPTTAMADRALRELKQLGKVTSDRIVRVLDQGRAPDGRVFVATERVDGAVTLEELVGREGALPLDRAKAIILQVGEALTEAQKVGVIHRDVAPRNVLVGPGDRVKVGDFGLAEAVSDRVFGAPAFLSPEQAEGKPVDQRSNIYSLGAVYYFALTGKAPFAGDAASLMQQHLTATPQPPSTLRPGLGADVDRVVLKALEKSGGRRHLTLRQLLTEVGGTATSTAAQPARAAADAKTVMGMEAPQIPAAAARPQPQPQPSAPPAAQPSAARPPAQTIMGIPPSATVAGMGPGTTPSMQAQPPPKAAPQAATVMAEAPRVPPTPAAPTATPAPPATPAAPPPQQHAPQAAAPQAPMPTPQPMIPHAAPQPMHQAATMMAEAPRVPPNHAPPAPAAATAAPVPAVGGGKNATGKKGAFRETAWFKRGEIEEEMAKAQAAAGDNPLKTGITGQHPPVDESQVALSAQDSARLSLKTGATQAMPVIKGAGTGSVQALPGERMNEEEMLAELNPSKKYFLIAGAVVVAIVLGVVIYFATRSAPKAEAPVPDKPAPVAAAPPVTTPAPTPAATPPAAPTPPPTTTKSAVAPTPAPAAAAAAPSAPASPSAYAAQVAKLEASGGDKKEVKRLEKLVAVEMKTAHKKKEKRVEEADRELLARLKKLRGR